MNCGHPFTGHEKFCPNCGQANKGKRITFKNFIDEVFLNGFLNFDAKFWTTIIPLLISPGKVSKDYIDGKRNRFSNPFRFYLTVSIIFFLIVGLSKTIDKFKALNEGGSPNNKESIFEIDTSTTKIAKKKLTPEEIDSIGKEVDEKLKKAKILPENIRTDIVKGVKEGAKDSIVSNSDPVDFDFGETRLTQFTQYQKKYPDSGIDQALDSLGYEKTFLNRFLYTKAANANKLAKNSESREEFVSQLLSLGSIALFVFLPFFTLFLKFYYIRRKFTYVEHLIFVFHVQTVFFMLFSIYYILEIAGFTPYLGLFIGLFLLYLYLAMKKFYQQGYFKTAAKFFLLNFSYMLVGFFGFMLVAVISFALY